jgi:uncharacterized membrane protein YciS (DUF1049 family)
MLSEIPGLHQFDAYLEAFAELNSSEIVALVLTLGVLLFAVVTAIMLVRTRRRASAADARSRVRTSMIAVTTANSSTPNVSAIATISLLLSSAKAAR